MYNTYINNSSEIQLESSVLHMATASKFLIQPRVASSALNGNSQFRLAAAAAAAAAASACALSAAACVQRDSAVYTGKTPNEHTSTATCAGLLCCALARTLLPLFFYSGTLPPHFTSIDTINRREH
eukprot:6802-Heterococcus_DN1.PRE.3